MMVNYVLLKRVFDVTLAAPLLIIFFIPTLILCLLIRVESKGCPIYCSMRVGIGGRIFSMPKIRTMLCNAPQLATDQIKNPNLYVTRLGKFYRRASLDELPQLWSILIGDMSFVGPRPALFNQYELIAKRNRRGIFAVKPGLTGLAQINGRDTLSDDLKLKYDLLYIKNQSLGFDLRIILLTIYVALTGRGVVH